MGDTTFYRLLFLKDNTGYLKIFAYDSLFQQLTLVEEASLAGIELVGFKDRNSLGFEYLPDTSRFSFGGKYLPPRPQKSL